MKKLHCKYTKFLDNIDSMDECSPNLPILLPVDRINSFCFFIVFENKVPQIACIKFMQSRSRIGFTYILLSITILTSFSFVS